MHRKKFITHTIQSMSAMVLPTVIPNHEALFASPIIPAYLSVGDSIGITAPAGYIMLEELLPAITQMESWGLKIKLGNTIGKRDGTFGGTDAERRDDFQQMLQDDAVKAIMCARGGYGFVRILDEIDFTAFRKKPKWIIGFSDITFLHSHLNSITGVASIHSKMCNSFPDNWEKADAVQIETILSIKKALMGEPQSYTAAYHSNNRLGNATGILVGGNLKTLETLSGSKSDIDTKGKILFVEDTGEYLYSIDRMFWNLKRSGKLDHLAGLIVGGFKIKPADHPEEEFGKQLFEIVTEKVKALNYPVCFDFPVGHQKNNFALKCGVKYALEVSTQQSLLKEV